MREKIKKLMSLIMTSFDDNVASYVDQFTAGFKQAHGEDLPADAQEAVGTITKALRDGRAQLEDNVAAIYEKHLGDEAVVDALITIYESDAYKKLAAASPAIMAEVETTMNAWVTDKLKSTEADLERILGVPAAPPPAAEPSELTDP